MERHESAIDVSATATGAEAGPSPLTPTGSDTAAKVSDSYDDDDADVTIVSSDGVTFKVHSYMPQAHSPIFRSMLSLATDTSQRSPIVLTHERIEHSAVLGLLLDIMYTHRVESFDDHVDIGCAIDLGEKWEFETVLDTIRQQLRLLLFDEDVDPCPLQHIAVKLKDHSAMSQIVGVSYQKGWYPQNEKAGRLAVTHTDAFPFYDDLPTSLPLSTGPLTGQRLFSPGVMGLEHFCRLPPVIAWAMARAERLAAKEMGENTSGKDVAKHFKALMNDIFKVLLIIVTDDPAPKLYTVILLSLESPNTYIMPTTSPSNLRNAETAKDTAGTAETNVSSNDQTPSSDLVYDEQYNSDDADITLISSDNIAFKVHSYRLQALSAVFRTMISVIPTSSANRTIHLTDYTVERNLIVKAVLNIIYDLEYSEAKDYSTLYKELDMLAFAAKYEMPLVAKVMALDALQARPTPQADETPDCELRKVWALKSPRLLKSVLQAHIATHRWQQNDFGLWSNVRVEYAYDEYNKRLEDEQELLRHWSNPSDFTYADFLHVPPTLVWIMLQATRVAKGMESEDEYKEAYKKEADRLIDLAFDVKDQSGHSSDGMED